MTLASKLRRMLTCGREKHSAPVTISEPHPKIGDDNTNDDLYGALSEVAAPGPVELTTEEEEARHESLDRNLSEPHSHPHLSNN